MERLFLRLWFIGCGFLLVLCSLMLIGLGHASAESAPHPAPNPEPLQFPNSWVLLVPLAFAAFEFWLFRREWKRQNPPKKSKVKALNRAPQLILIQPSPAPKTRRRAVREREKVLV